MFKPDISIRISASGGLRRMVARGDTGGGKAVQALGVSSRQLHAGTTLRAGPRQPDRQPLYTPAERERRDATRWTLVQGILAPVQFAIFLISLGLVLRCLATGEGYEAANISVLIKTVALYVIMITGAIWEKVVFGRYLFAPAFYWEDMVSMLVMALHTAYVVAVFTDALSPSGLMVLALAAYATYAINAVQFVLKLRAARLDRRADRLLIDTAMVRS